jgi:Protein of unknown function (DUF3293)
MQAKEAIEGRCGKRAIPARTLLAYRKSSYAAGGVEIRIGRRCPPMDRLLSSYGAREAVFITAHNPFSRIMPPGWNRRMQARLVQALHRCAILPATGSWRGWSETHVLVIGDARRVRRQALLFRQNGIVIVRSGQPTRLLVAS